MANLRSKIKDENGVELVVNLGHGNFGKNPQDIWRSRVGDDAADHVQANDESQASFEFFGYGPAFGFLWAA